MTITITTTVTSVTCHRHLLTPCLTLSVTITTTIVIVIPARHRHLLRTSCDDYYYDYGDERNSSSSSSSRATNDNSFEQLIGIAVPTLFGLIVLIGFVGNLVVVLVVSLYRRARTATSLLMLNLSVADLLFIVICVPTTAARYALPIWPLGAVWCKVRLPPLLPSSV